jgi:hypothetical protein
MRAVGEVRAQDEPRASVRTFPPSFHSRLLDSPSACRYARDAMMNALEDTVNEVSDGAAAWWPFAFLRPAPHERLTSTRVLVLAALYGLFAGLLVDVLARACHRALPVHPGAFPVGMTLALFAVHRFTFAYFWNRRASRLSLARARRAAWGQAEGLPKGAPMQDDGLREGRSKRESTSTKE